MKTLGLATLSYLLKVIKLEGGRPWGFKIAGGAEVNKPILITKVIPMSSKIISQKGLLSFLFKKIF